MTIRHLRNRGFTLAEVAIGMAVFVVLLVTSSIAIVQTQKLAHANVMHNTARTVVEGYMEQMKGISYNKFKECMADPDNIPLDTKGISSLITGGPIEYDDPLYIGIENQKEVMLDIREESDGSLTPITMDVYITPTIVDLVPTEGIQVYEITLSFRYESLFKGVTSEYDNSIRFIKTAVSEY